MAGLLKLKKKVPIAEATTVVKDHETVVSEVTEKLDANANTSSATKGTSPGPFCEVGIESSYTHNLGNYKSCRYQVSLKVPCLTAEIDTVYDYAEKWVENKIGKVVAELTAEG
ncbi:MAG: hypothetical protein ACHP9V_05840 [Terriglobales bacterium]